MKRSHRLFPSIDNYAMALALLEAQRSPDPYLRMGAVIVLDSSKNIIALGHNKLKNSITTKEIDWASPDRHLFMQTAIVSAIDSSEGDLSGCTVYSTGYPTYEDANIVIRKGCTKIVYGKQKDIYASERDQNLIIALKTKIFGLDVTQFKGSLYWLNDITQFLNNSTPEMF